jgi:hypothetical protein
VAGGHLSQHVQQIGDGGPQSIGLGFDTMLEMGIGLNSTQKLAQEYIYIYFFISNQIIIKKCKVSPGIQKVVS